MPACDKDQMIALRRMACGVLGQINSLNLSRSLLMCWDTHPCVQYLSMPALLQHCFQAGRVAPNALLQQWDQNKVVP